MKSWKVLCAAGALLGVGCNVGSGDNEPGPVLDPNIAVDTRAAIIAETPPPSISGGTLLVVDGYTAVVADPDRDRISLVDLATPAVIAHIALNAGDEPGRLVEGADGRVHVVLRGSGEVATVDLDSATVINRTRVCGSPRGIAYESPTSQLHVACQGGDLVTLNVNADAETRVLRSIAIERTVQVASDLRDVILRGDQLLVTRFRSAELLEINRADGVLEASRGLRSTSQIRDRFDEFNNFTREVRDFDANVAWRALSVGQDKVAVVHQRAMSTEVNIGDPHNGSTENELPLPPMNDNPYGGSGGGFPSCDGIVQSAVSVVDEAGKVVQTPSLSNSILPVDAAFDSLNNFLVVVNAGLRDPNAPTRNSGVVTPGGFGPEFGGPLDGFGFGGFGGLANTGGSISRVPLTSTGDVDTFSEGNCLFDSIPVEGQPVAVALTGDSGIVVQSREPAMLVFVNSTGQQTLALGGDSVFDTGHEIFHRDAGGGIACASCHAEGAEDGHVWLFSGFGERRTQALNIGIEGTEPFHWSGDMPRMSNIMAEVFVHRMGGAQQTEERLAALNGWMFAQQPSAPLRAANDPAVMRGHDLFNADEVGCNSCHAGAKLTDNQTVDVGTGEPFQTPSLIAVVHRAPFMHTGCAETLRDRFTDTDCGGGDRHGQTSQLEPAQIDDLVAYLESL